MRASLGFTLIELSIVLVIIGLIVGGILTGQELIRASGVRATIAQVERYNTAANTFRGKYGYLPGDIRNPDATNFGFANRGSYAGEGDGSGVIEGVDANSAGQNDGVNILKGETGMFWVDLTVAHLIDGSFTSASPTSGPGADPTGSAIDQYFPAAKIGKGNHFYIWSGGWKGCYGGAPPLNKGDAVNYFSVSNLPGVLASNGQAYNATSMTPEEALSIDAKTDDGLPQSGRVLAMFPSDIPGNNCWAAATGHSGAYNAANAGPTTTATPSASTNCYDNNNNAGNQTYATEPISKSNPNCALSFMFQ